VAAEAGEAAGVAFWFAGYTDVAAVEDEPVMCDCPFLQRNQFVKVLFNLQRGFSAREAKAVRYPKDMGINGYYRFVVYD
jgi:hypothetical protein